MFVPTFPNAQIDGYLTLQVETSWRATFAGEESGIMAFEYHNFQWDDPGCEVKFPYKRCVLSYIVFSTILISHQNHHELYELTFPPNTQIQKHMISGCHYHYLIASTTRPWSKRWLQLTWWAVQRSMQQGLPRIHMSFMRKSGRMIWIQSKRCLIVNIFSFWEVGGFLH